MPIPTYYGDEICHVNGLKYAFNVIKATVLSRAQEFGILYERKFDVSTGFGNPLYQPKMEFESPHSLAVQRVEVQVLPVSSTLDARQAMYLGR